jgi:hypothetical protein
LSCIFLFRTNMNVNVISKKVGDVNILELISGVGGRSGSVVEERMERIMEEPMTKALLVQMLLLHDLSFDNAKTLSRGMAKVSKGGFLTRDDAVIESLEKANPTTEIKIFHSEGEAASFMAREMAADDMKEKCSEEFPEKRRADRLPAIVPMYFGCEVDFEQELCLFAVVTNLSEFGLYARFIDSYAEKIAVENLDPYDLKLLQLNLQLPDQRMLKMRGKLVRHDFVNGGIGIEFYENESEKMLVLRRLLHAIKSIEERDQNGERDFSK